MNADRFTRRNIFTALGVTSLGAVGAIWSPKKAHSRVANLSLSGPYLNVGTEAGALLARARVSGNIDPSKRRFDFFDGQVMAVAPNGNVMPFAGVRGWIETELQRDDRGWLRSRRIFGTYYEQSTGHSLAELHNPFTGEVVTVEHMSGATSVDRLAATQAGHWSMGGENFDFQDSAPICLRSDESHEGATAYCVTSHSGALADLQNPELTTVKDRGAMTIVADWLPWLKMGRVPGNCLFQCRRVGGFERVSELPLPLGPERHA
jgi:hypothetical protein